MPKFLVVIMIPILTICCKPQQPNDFKAAIINDSTTVTLQLGDINKLVCTVADSITNIWPLRYPVYQYQSGNLDRKGNIDLAVGVYKTTRYDSVKRNRLFLFQVRNNSIIPLWLGSSLGHPIVDFRVLENPEGVYFVRIIGRERSDKYLIADYAWHGFGLTLTDYMKRDVTLEIAQEYLYYHE